ncbi:hypothetical protein BDQ12DRAFT_659060 [Crucibulum laeve]|uniref:F-box domain-containing protein n=1 Tax=Crucibulum laeve TaxID=68775 RepID=A0A5C3LUV8_9AGAR|nr:hypothetical protein BDQ12DRAFT_659060 [Crucibulum laeve]
MASFSNVPFDITEKIIDTLQDDLSALKSCSLTCQLLLPLCRKHMFQSLTLFSFPSQAVFVFAPPQWYHTRHPFPLLRNLLDSNPGIADYVQNLIYETGTSLKDSDQVLRILETFRRVQSLEVVGVSSDWDEMPPTLTGSISRIIQPSVTHLDIRVFGDVSITIFIPCVNLASLTLSAIYGTVVDIDKLKKISPGVVPQLQSFHFGNNCSRYVMCLVKARYRNDLPVLDFSNLRTLNVRVDNRLDLGAAQALTKVARMLETLHYTVRHFANGYKGLAASINPSSFSTLKRLYFHYYINHGAQDPLYGINDELKALSDFNVIEEIHLEITIDIEFPRNTSNEWGNLDSILAAGFPFLKTLTLSVTDFGFPTDGSEIIFLERLEKLPEEQFPLLSTNSRVVFKFTRV